MPDPDDLRTRIEAELLNLADERVATAVRTSLISPRPIKLDWDYGEPGQQLPGWLVLNDPANGAAIAYCEQGFGPSAPWGLVCPEPPDDRFFCGMDSGWFPTFLDAWLDSGSSVELDLWVSGRRTETGAFDALIQPTTLKAAFEDRDRRAAQDLSGRYDIRAAVAIAGRP